MTGLGMTHGIETIYFLILNYGTGINEIGTGSDNVNITIIKTTFLRKVQIYLAIAG
jgi:hypothetical protein